MKRENVVGSAMEIVGAVDQQLPPSLVYNLP